VTTSPPPPLTLRTVDLDELRGWFGIGVAGNFAGHLEQAGEAGDFANVEAAGDAPKGIFPFYAPGHDGFLAEFPLSHDEIAPPAGGEAPLQVEPEVALACEVAYARDGTVTGLRPVAFGAFNDCSIRRPAPKLSHKKNWGAASKGVADRFFPVDCDDLHSACGSHRLASFLRRDGELVAYGVDSPLTGYSYFGDRLLDWLVDRLAGQRGAADDPLEPVGAYMDSCGRPRMALVAIGATRYTEFGESDRLRPGDETIVAVYDSTVLSPSAVEQSLADGDAGALGSVSLLIQRVG